MGPVIVFAFWAFAGVSAGAILFGVLALVTRALPSRTRRPALITSAVVSAVIALLVAAAMPAWFFLSPFLPDNPKSDFRAIFASDPPDDVTILSSHSSAGTDFSEAVVAIKISDGRLRALVAAWRPGAVSVDALPASDELEPIAKCSSVRAFLDDSSGVDSTTKYRAVLYCGDTGFAKAVSEIIE